MKYRPIRVEEYTDNASLQELLKMVGTTNIDPQVAQAAAWNIGSEMSWKDLRGKAKSKLAGNYVPYFSPAELLKAEQLVSSAVGKARERKDDDTTKSKPKVETRKPLPQ
jgi:hypothetical protein